MAEEAELTIPEPNGNHTDHVRRLFQQNPDTIFSPKKIKELLPEVPDAYLAPLLKRLREAGQIDRIQYGKYRTPRKQPPQPTPDTLHIEWARPDAASRLIVLATSDNRIYVAIPLEEHLAA